MIAATHFFMRFLAPAALILLPFSTASGDTPSLELLDGDRVIFLGDGLIEQEQYHGWIEVSLTAAFPDSSVTFRNLGWNADTPRGDSRFGLSLVQAGYASGDEAWKQLRKQLEQAAPSVVILGYGMASSLEHGVDGQQVFEKQYDELLAWLKQYNPSVRIVCLSPLSRVSIGNQSSANFRHAQSASLKSYQAAIRTTAERENAIYIDISKVALDPKLRRNEVHLNDLGYQALAAKVTAALGISPITNFSHPPVQRLRNAIRKKNEWFFHRSRPANMAYVFGFRKREQGQNAVEIPQFDKLIEAEEKHIAALRGLRTDVLPTPAERTKSAFAKFTTQPLPEFTTADELEISLWAENPMLNKPIQINFDARGRLWVASSEAYPMIEVGQTANDRIIILEDSNHDGRADQSTVFAEGLLIPTGVLPNAEGDGAYVAQSTDLLLLEDTNGDGQADKKTRVLSGFGTEDTHHNLHTLRWGPDGRIYMNQSVYTRTDTETPRGVLRLKAGGGFRFHPETMRMQVFFSGLWNSWGHQFDSFGRSFMSDGAGFAGLAYVFPGAKFHPLPGGQRKLDLISPGSYPKFCSAEIVAGPSFPEAWQQSIVTCDFRANRVTRFSLLEKEAGYETVQEADLVRTSNATFRPIDVKQGPDGALYVADWSNPIINHGEVDFRDPRRDRWHGRIWRIAWTKREATTPAPIGELTIPQLFTALASTDRYRRDTARQVLLDQPLNQLEPALAQWSAQQDSAMNRLQALWLYQSIQKPNPALLIDLLKEDSADIRSAATRVLADWADPQTDCVSPLAPETRDTLFRQAIRDPHPRVRLEAIAGLHHIDTTDAAVLALTALEQPSDRFIDFALAELVNDIGAPLLTDAQTANFTPQQIEFILANVQPTIARQYVGSYLATHALPRDGSGPWIRLIGQIGGEKELQTMLNAAIDGQLSAPATAAVLQALFDAQRLRKKQPALKSKLETLLRNRNLDIQIAAVKLAGSWKMSNLADSIIRLANDSQQPLQVRIAATESMPAWGRKAELKALAESSQHPPRLASTALRGLANLDSDLATDVFVSRLGKIESDQTAALFWRAILSTPSTSKRIAANLDQVQPSLSEVRTGLRIAREGGRTAPELVAALGALGDSQPSKSLTPAEIATRVTAAQSEGDPRRGEEIYFKSELACVSCHAVAGTGGAVGPDLSSIGASAPIDYIAESLYTPNAKIKENYHSVTILTADGKQITGIPVQSETAEQTVLRNAANELIQIPNDEIELKQAGPSLMPAGLIERLPVADQIDLVQFLSQLGKPGEFDTSNRNVARYFEIFAGTHRVEQQGIQPILEGKVPGWQPIRARLSGKLSKDTMLRATRQPRNIALVTIYLKTNFSVLTNEDVTFQIDGLSSMWIDEANVREQDGKYTTKLMPGNHQVVVRLDARQLPDEVFLSGENIAFQPPR